MSTQAIPQAVLDCAKDLGYDGVELLFSHNGVSYYAPVEDGASYTGYPTYIVEYTAPDGSCIVDEVVDVDFSITEAIDNQEKRSGLLSLSAR